MSGEERAPGDSDKPGRTQSVSNNLVLIVNFGQKSIFF